MFGNDARSQPMPLAIDAIRLVYPITNPETGTTRDVVIHELKAIPPNMKSPNMTLDRWEHGYKWDRIVPGINVVIPWPEVQVPKAETFEGDTIRADAEERTFYYNLLSPPMPETIIDELRNKFSKFRTRHEDWYVQQKEAEAMSKQARLESIKSMQTPLQEFHEMQREKRAEEGEPELSEEMLEKLGAIIAQRKDAALKKAGVSEIAATDASLPSSTPTPPTQ